MCIRLLLAAFLGSLIGVQREHLFWTAGLRTHMLVCAGACLVMIVSAFGFQQALTMPGAAGPFANCRTGGLGDRLSGGRFDSDAR